MNDGRQDKLLSARTVGLRGAEARAGVLQGLLAVHPLGAGIEMDPDRAARVLGRVAGIVQRCGDGHLDPAERVDEGAKASEVDHRPPVDGYPGQLRHGRRRQVAGPG